MGTGTSQGIPFIGCSCEVCKSTDLRDARLRSSILLQLGDVNIVIDTGPDFRQQMLRNKVEHLNAIFITHEHNDHIAGLDDIRPFNFKQKESMPIYTSQRVANELKKKFDYIFEEEKYPGAPSVSINLISEKTFSVNGFLIEPIHYHHGHVPVLGFRVGDLAYLTDIKTIEKNQEAKLKGVNTLIVSALHQKEHHSHFNLQEALSFIEKVNAKQSFLTHISHRMGTFNDASKLLPNGVQIAYDGLEVDISLQID